MEPVNPSSGMGKGLKMRYSNTGRLFGGGFHTVAHRRRDAAHRRRARLGWSDQTVRRAVLAGLVVCTPDPIHTGHILLYPATWDTVDVIRSWFSLQDWGIQSWSCLQDGWIVTVAHTRDTMPTKRFLCRNEGGSYNFTEVQI